MSSRRELCNVGSGSGSRTTTGVQKAVWSLTGVSSMDV